MFSLSIIPRFYLSVRQNRATSLCKFWKLEKSRPCRGTFKGVLRNATVAKELGPIGGRS